MTLCSRPSIINVYASLPMLVMMLIWIYVMLIWNYVMLIWNYTEIKIIKHYNYKISIKIKGSKFLLHDTTSNLPGSVCIHATLRANRYHCFLILKPGLARFVVHSMSYLGEGFYIRFDFLGGYGVNHQHFCLLPLSFILSLLSTSTVSSIQQLSHLRQFFLSCIHWTLPKHWLMCSCCDVKCFRHYYLFSIFWHDLSSSSILCIMHGLLYLIWISAMLVY